MRATAANLWTRRGAAASPLRQTEAPLEIERAVTRLDGLAITSVRPPRATGTPLVFVPGLFAAGWIFDRWMRYFAEHGRGTHALDLRGHGASTGVAQPGRVGLADYTEDVLRAVRAIGRVVAVGHSMGGLLAQRLAEQGVIAAAVLVSPAPPRGIPLVSARLVVRQARYLPAMLRSRPIQVRRQDADAIILNRVPASERSSLFARFEPDSGRAGREIMVGAVAVDARRVRCPILVVTGDDDRFIPVGVARQVAAKYGAPLCVLRGRGHLMMQEPGWEAAAGEIERWLAASSL